MNLRILPVAGFALCYSAIMVLAVPIPQSTPMEECTKRTASLKVGMTRGDVMKIMAKDGGIAGIYKGERFVLMDNGKPVPFLDANQKYATMCKVTFDFRPQGIPDKAYNDPSLFQRWMSDHAISAWGSPSDAIAKVSAPFLEPGIAD